VNNPASWEEFVNDSGKNIAIKDTFRFQSFEGTPIDNWNYYSEEGYRFDATADGISGQGGDTSLKLPSNANITFDSFDLSLYENVVIIAGVAARSLAKNNTLYLQSIRGRENTFFESHWFKAGTDNYSVSYRDELFIDKSKRANPIQIPNGHTLFMSAPNISGSGYISIDSVFAHGDIPSYSLFTGKGNWNDTVRWTHLPSARHRNALIKGEAIINSFLTCNDVSISNGSLHIGDNSNVEINNLCLYETEAFFTSNNDINIKDHITIYRTFEEKDEWYFISFPFDVYREGIDPYFELKDDTPNAGGNYFYVLTYNGEKRQTSNSSTGNWEVHFPPQNSTTPIFEKNKGYLIALDAGAGKQTMTFSSSDEIPTDFGKSAILAINVSSSADEDNDNAGWFLCGNPYPAPLSLSQFPKTPELDGFIYVYDGIQYKAYAIGSKYKLPPYSAFFVKANTNTEISLTKAIGTEQDILLPLSTPLRFANAEPEKRDPLSVVNKNNSKSFVMGNILSTTNMRETARLYVYSTTGNLVMQRIIPTGSSEFLLPLSKGFYILCIESSTYRAQHKCVINQ